MSIIVHQAIYGELNGGWELLNTSLPNKTAAKKIRFQTDLKEKSPSGIPWKPIVRGFSVDEFYIITKTYPDDSSDVRPGRVFSHSLIVEKSDLASINNLKTLFSYFRETIDKSILIEPIEYSDSSQDIFLLENELIPRFNKLIHGIVEATRYKNVIVWIGQDYFDSIVCAAWTKISISERESFSFGVNFNPKEVSNDHLTIVTTPTSLENKWVNTEYCVIKKDDAYELKSFIELYVSGDTDASNRLNRFIKEIESSPVGRDDLAFLSKGVSTYENISSKVDFRSVYMLYQIVSESSPQKKKGVAFKQQLLAKLCTIFQTSSEHEVIALRKIKTTAFENTESKLSSAFRVWVNDNLFSIKANTKNKYAKLFEHYKLEDSDSWWNVTLAKELKRFLANINAESAEIVWKWFLNDVSLIETFKNSLDKSKDCEINLISKFPNEKNSEWLSKIKSLALTRNWLRLYATALVKEFDLESALSEQLKVDNNENYVEGIHQITDLMKPKQLLNFSVNHGDSRLLSICGQLCHKDITLLNKLEVKNKNWRSIWVNSIKNGNSVDDGLVKPKNKVFEVLDLFFDGVEVEEILLESISSSSYANLLDYKNRNAVWMELPIIYRHSFLDKTASALLEQLSESPSIEIPDDEVLERYIVENSISDFLYFNRSDFKKTIPIFLKFNGINESILEDYVYYYNGRLSIIDALRLGKFVQNRNYGRVAKAIYEKAKRNEDFKVALNECIYELNLFDRGNIFLWGFLSNIRFTEDQWWEVFTETLIELYPKGPEQKKLWQKAGGEISRLNDGGNIRDKWENAIETLTKGAAGGNISTIKVIEQVKKDFDKNPKIELLEKLFYELGGKF